MTSARTAPSWLIYSAIAGAAIALAGGYWDDAWHTERGRDSFWIAPHVLLYSGVTLIGAALTLRCATALRRQGITALRSDSALLLACAAVAATLISGPIDNVWHEAFGRDAVLWSPPHMLGIVGTLALGAALLLQTSSRPAVHGLVGGLVIAAATFPVAEYDTDVPQFAVLWYLPVLTAGVAVAFALCRATSAAPWACTRAALAQSGFFAGVCVLLLLVGLKTPGAPLLLLAAVVQDQIARRVPAWAGPVLLAAGITIAYVPVRTWIGEGVQFSATDALGGFALSCAAAWLVARVTDPPAPRLRIPGPVLAALLTVALLMPTSALAHDPGQGTPAGEAAMSLTAAGRRLSLEGELRPCRDISGGRIVARRAGRSTTAPMTVDGCSFSGRVLAGARGRYFVYAQLLTGGRRVETWLPIDARRGTRVIHDSDRFAYEPNRRPAKAVKWLAGGALYAVMLAFLATTLRLTVRQPRPPT